MSSHRIDLKTKKMCQFKGVPPYHLPKWRYLPLQNKLPMLKKIPEGAVSLYVGDGSIGKKPWITNKSLDFDLWDPGMRKLPCEKEYDSLRDPYLKCYFSNSKRLKFLYKQGLITRDGKTITDLKTYNKYRSYLHYMNVNILKSLQTQTECEDVNKLVLSTMLRKKREEAERMKEKDQCSDIPLSLKYSDVLRKEMMGECERAEMDFKKSSYFKKFPEGEQEFLIKLRELLLKQVKKKALLRLRKLQLYEESQSSFWHKWLMCTKSEIQNRADDLVKRQVFRYERCKHIAEYEELVANRRANMTDAVTRARQEHLEKQTAMIRKVRENICNVSHRQYPLSAICPYNFFDGGNWETSCPYQEIVDMLHDQLFCEDTAKAVEDGDEEEEEEEEEEEGEGPKGICATNKKEEEKKDCRGKKEDKAMQNVTVADKLVNDVIKNSLALTVKHLRLPYTCAKNNKPSTFKTIRNTYFVQEIMAAIKTEMARLLKDNMKTLKKVTNSNKSMKSRDKNKKKNSAEDEEEPEDEKLWENAPLMKSNSSTAVGRYVKEQLLQIATKLKNDGSAKLSKDKAQDLKTEQRFQNAITEVTTARNLYELSCQLIEGKKIICQALEIIRIFEREEDEEEEEEEEEEKEEEEEEVDEEEEEEEVKEKKKKKKTEKASKDELVYNLITSLIMNALFMIRDSLACKAIESDDIFTLCAIVNKKEEKPQGKLMCKEIERLIDNYSEKLMKNRCMYMLIKNTAKQIRCSKDNPRSEDEISKSILNATRKFVAKVVENIVAEVKIAKKEESDSEEDFEDEVICCENVSEECIQECDESEDECLVEAEPDEASFIPNPDLSGSDHPETGGNSPDAEDESELETPKSTTPKTLSDKHYSSQSPDSISKPPGYEDSPNTGMTPGSPDTYVENGLVDDYPETANEDGIEEDVIDDFEETHAAEGEEDEEDEIEDLEESAAVEGEEDEIDELEETAGVESKDKGKDEIEPERIPEENMSGDIPFFEM